MSVGFAAAERFVLPDDGGWAFDRLGWSPGQQVEWRGEGTVRALHTLAALGRLRSGG